MEYHLSTKGGTFSDYIFDPENEAKVKEALGESNVVLDRDAKTITYKGTLYQVGTDGGVTKLDGIGLSESQKELTIVGSEKEQFSLTATLTNITGTITWTSSNPNVATIIGSGNTVTVIAAGAGTTTITASCSGKEATCNVTVKQVTKTTSMKLDKETATLEQGSQIEIKVSQKDGTDDIIWEVLDSSGNSTSDKAVVAVKEGTNGATVVVTGKAKGTVKIKAKTKYYETGASCTLEITEPSYVGAYFDYNVAYTDAYDSTKTYTNLTGWRVLNKVDNGDGTSNLDIISTGIPAGLYYNTGYIKDATYSPWAGTAAQITDYITNYYTSGSNTYSNMYAVSGLRYNFEKIKFKKLAEGKTYDDSEDNKGYYKEISKNGIPQTKEIDGTTFKARTGAEVRSVIHSDITGDKKSSSITVADTLDKKGLFILQNYTPDKHNDSYYWLASPDPSDYDNVRYVGYNGGVGEWGYIVYYGVRPVVSMTNVKMQRKAGNSHVWEIVD